MELKLKLPKPMGAFKLNVLTLQASVSILPSPKAFKSPSVFIFLLNTLHLKEIQDPI